MKSYTDLEQSRKLAEILPLESADMSWVSNGLGKPFARTIPIKGDPEELCACWSLTALLDILPSSALDSSNDHHYRLHCMERFTEWYNNPIDACYEMIIKLHEQKLL